MTPDPPPPLLTGEQIADIGGDCSDDDSWSLSFARAIELAAREPLLKAIAERDSEIERLKKNKRRGPVSEKTRLKMVAAQRKRRGIAAAPVPKEQLE